MSSDLSTERRREIEQEEAVRAELRRNERDRRGVAIAVWVVGVIAPAIALVRDWKTWYYWLWLVAGVAVALALEFRRRPT